MKYWLLKSEAALYSIDDLAKEKKQTTYWDGVRNYQARNFLRDKMKIGDQVIFYHSNSDPTGCAGVCEVVKESYLDFTAFDPADTHYDPKSRKESPTWFMVDIRLVKKFSKFIPLEEIKSNQKLKMMTLIQRGNRLSVMPLSKAEFNELVMMGR